jgi:hypothetical protein
MPNEVMPKEVAEDLGECLKVTEAALDEMVDDVLADLRGDGSGEKPVQPTLREELDEILGEIAVDAGDRGRMRWVSAIQMARVLLKEPPVQAPPEIKQDAKKGFTVVLLYPDYMQDGGETPQTYAMYSTAATQSEAVKEARDDVTREHDMAAEKGEGFRVVAIFDGDTGWDVQDDD